MQSCCSTYTIQDPARAWCHLTHRRWVWVNAIKITTHAQRSTSQVTSGPVKLITKTSHHITLPFGLLEKLGMFVTVHCLNILYKSPVGTLAFMETLITNSQLSNYISSWNAFDSFCLQKIYLPPLNCWNHKCADYCTMIIFLY